MILPLDIYITRRSHAVSDQPRPRPGEHLQIVVAG
jgi:hypothetical protein